MFADIHFVGFLIVTGYKLAPKHLFLTMSLALVLFLLLSAFCVYFMSLFKQGRDPFADPLVLDRLPR